MEYRRPILQEMDTQEYDWVRLYTEKIASKAVKKLRWRFCKREVYLCVKNPNSL